MRESVLDTSRVEILEAQDRTRGVGGTDSSAIMGVSPWSSPLQVYRDKVGERRSDFSSNRMAIGNALEPFVLEKMCGQLDIDMTHGQTYVRDRKKPWMLGSVDGIGFDGDLGIHCILEAKTSSSQPWESPPLHYQVQVQHYMGVTGLTRAYIGALFLEGDYPLVVYPVDFDPEVWNIIQEADTKFWTEYVVPKRPPKPNETIGDRKALEDLWPRHTQGAVAELGPEYMAYATRIDELASVIKEAESEKSGLENLVREAIGEAEFGRLPSGEGWSYRVTERKEYTVAATSYRQLRRAKVEQIAKALKGMKPPAKAD